MKFAKFQSVKNKASSKRLICHDTVPPNSSSQQILSLEKQEKPQLGVSRMVSVCKGNENIEMLYRFRLLFYHNRKTFYL